MKHTNVLLAGATGYLGGFFLKVLIERKNQVVAIVRNPDSLQNDHENYLEIKQAQVTRPETLRDICKGIHTVISTVGITRQKDGLTYMNVDYQANMNLLEEAKKAGVKHFVYVSAINGDKNRHLKILEAKEKFVDTLKASGLHYTIVRPNGFFSDMKDFLEMAKSGRVYLFGSGHQKFNPIHGDDLARAILATLDDSNKELTIGGPDVLSLNEISELALKTLNKPVKMVHLPDWSRKLTIWFLRTFTSVKTYGPIEFFLTLMAEDCIAPCFGTHHLEDFYKEVVQNNIEPK
ncbi:SDR family oxidoreductase [Maribacter algicola]|uniref:Divinyl chlorophyllide a 8-vinyl-reductase, chloroplastic n=1 Tax=Maribacter algicola TaxID=2498892 RepID=A0A3R8RLR9_9FLAO|nr:SDR family oxidoreductase [Maribacter algicola]RRQ48381.1 SDR family oxidoreductase [Maribacter algicola]